MPKIYVTDRRSTCHEVEANDDMPLMFQLRDAELPVEGTCGGTASCGTCHVYIEDGWYEKLGNPNGLEMDMLEALENFVADHSRLSCQITLDERHDGLELTLAPEELV